MSISKIVVSGRVVRAPEKRFTPNTNVAVTEFAIAVESPAKQDGTVESQPVKVITWRDLAERCAQEIKKGDLVAVDGRLQINSFTNQEGQRRRDAEIEASSVENLTLLVAQGGAPAAAVPSEDGRSFAKAAAKPAARPAQQQDDLDAIFASEDEIPF
ncbi:MAG TPA: single-stranded DNA-binding protein [Candidatus Obscuribacterales bacterium]